MELILSEVIYFGTLPQTALEKKKETSLTLEYPKIQEYLNDGYSIKSIFQEPVCAKDKQTIGIAVTVVLQKLL